jgi:hypothetical protein
MEWSFRFRMRIKSIIAQDRHFSPGQAFGVCSDFLDDSISDQDAPRQVLRMAR